MQEYLNIIKQKDEIFYKEVKLQDEYYTIIYLKNMIKTDILEKIMISIVYNEEGMSFEKRCPGIVSTISDISPSNLDYLISSGNVIIIYKQHYHAIFINNQPVRSISDSLLDPSNLLDSRDGFIEKLSDNILLIKKRIKTSKLLIETLTIGSDTKTDVSILYLNNKDNLKTIYQIKRKLQEKKIQAINSVNDLSINLGNEALVPPFKATSSPEVCANAILNNKIIVMIDNSPVALILPTSFFLFTDVKDEVNAPKYYTIFSRVFILFFLFLSLDILGAFVLITSYHPEILSPIMIANLQLTERGTSFPLFLELSVVLLLFEFYRFVTSRSPMTFVQNIVIIFGGLFIGTNAIDSGAIGAIALLMASLAYVSAFAITNNPQLITTLSIFRWSILILTTGIGLIGFLISNILIFAYLASINNYDMYYLHPFVPFNLEAIKKWFIPRKG